MSVAQTVLMLINGRGDYLMNLPAMRAICHRLEGAVTLVCGPGARRAILHDLPVRRVIEPDFVKDDLGPCFDVFALAKELGPVDRFLSLNPWHTASASALLIALDAPRSVGFFPGFRTVLPLDFNKHSMDLAFDVARNVDPALHLETFAWAPDFPARDEALAKAIIAQLPPGRRLVGIHGETGKDKMWGPDKFGAVIRWILAEDPQAVVMDLGLRPAVSVDLLGAGRYLHLDGLVLPAALALVRHLDLFVGVDSCFLHAADLYRVPGVGLFGPTEPAEFGFRLGARHAHIRAPAMAGIEPEVVIEAIASVLQTPVPTAGPSPARLTMSSIGFGTASLPTDDGKSGLEESERICAMAVSAGIRTFDCAPNYAGGQAEVALGRSIVQSLAAGALARPDLTVISKTGYPGTQAEFDLARALPLDPDGLPEMTAETHCLASTFIRHQFLGSQKRLGLGRIDAYLLHNPEEQLVAFGPTVFTRRLDRALDVLARLRSADMIGRAGIAFSSELFAIADPVGLLTDILDMAGNRLDLVQLPFSLAQPEALLSRGDGPTLLDLLQSRQVSVIASSALGGMRLPDRALQEIARLDPDLATPAEIALQFARSVPGVDCVVFGSRSCAHVANLARLIDRPLLSLS